MDNVRREMDRLSAAELPEVLDTEWPEFLRPLVARPVAMKALFDLVASIDRWFSDDGELVSLKEPPDDVVAASKSFMRVRIGSRYDPLFSGRDWLEAADEALTKKGDFRVVLKMLLKAVPGQ